MMLGFSHAGGGFRRAADPLGPQSSLVVTGAITAASIEAVSTFKRPDRSLPLGCSAFEPTAAASWFAPNATADYWRTSAGGVTLHAALDGMEIGQILRTIQLQFYRGTAANPTINAYVTGSAGAAQLITPTIAWTAPASTSAWGTLVATYESAIVLGNYQLVVSAAGIGDRVRFACLTVGDP